MNDAPLYVTPKRQTQYRLVWGATSEALGRSVSEKLSDGWFLYGMPFVDSSGRSTDFYQAVVR